MMRDLFADLMTHTGATPDRKGECWIDCPSCGKSAKSRHASFSADGWHCFACGNGGGLVGLARTLGILTREDVPAILPQPRPARAHKPPAPTWTAQARVFAQHPATMARWQAYKPLPADVIVDRGLGVGCLPVGKRVDGAWQPCDHERLLVPLIADGVVIGWRARADVCDCCRWLSPSGSRMYLYNGARLLPNRARRGASSVFEICDTVGNWDCAGRDLVICENPIDAALVEELWQMPAIATLGVSNWRSDWTQLVAQAGVSSAIVAFDNDLAGNGGSIHRDQLVAEYRAKHDGRGPAAARGVWLANELRAAGVDAQLYDWRNAPAKADIGELIKATAKTIVAEEI